jgi:hypothetical protein
MVPVDTVHLAFVDVIMASCEKMINPKSFNCKDFHVIASKIVIFSLPRLCEVDRFHARKQWSTAETMARPAKTAAKPKKPKSNGECLLHGCKRKAFARGVCQADYLAMHRAVQAGNTNWEQLISEGLCLHDQRGSKAVATKYLDALKKKGNR